MSDSRAGGNNFRDIQQQARQNALETASYLSELEEWGKDIRQKDVTLQTQTSSSSAIEQHFPVRTSFSISPSDSAPPPTKNITATSNSGEPVTQEPKNPVQSRRIKSSDYSAWEKFDADEACDDVDYEMKSAVQLEKSGKFRGETTTPMSNMEKAVAEKSRGNVMFEDGRFAEAVDCYSRAIQLDATNPVYFGNRAMALLKLNKYNEAESDCSAALELDGNFVKAYHRRATARLSLKNLSGAKDDWHKLLKLDPKNKDAKDKLKIIEQWEEKQKRSSGMKSVISSAAKATEFGDRSRNVLVPAGQNASTDGKIRVFPLESSNSISQNTLRKVTIRDSGAAPSTTTHPNKSPISNGSPLSHDEIILVAPPSAAKSSLIFAAPSSPRDFQQACAALSNNPHASADYIKLIAPASYCKLIGQNLELESFNTILRGALQLIANKDSGDAFAHLAALSTVPRFSFFAHCISTADKESVKRFLEARMSAEGTSTCKESALALAKRYLISL